MLYMVSDEMPATGAYVSNYTTSFQDLERAFGQPANIDPEKVSTRWFFKHRGKRIWFELYDYKETNSYNPATIERFRHRPSYAWHIRASGTRAEYHLDEFKAWLDERIHAAIDVQTPERKKFEKEMNQYGCTIDELKRILEAPDNLLLRPSDTAVKILDGAIELMDKDRQTAARQHINRASYIIYNYLRDH